jgi:hypothetical protein
MTPERRKCAVREAPQRCPLLDNGSLDTFRQQRIAHNNIGIVGGGDLYSVRPEVIKGGHVRTFSSSVQLSVQLWSVNQRTTEAEEVTDS